MENELIEEDVFSKSTKRAMRRHHRQRLKRKVRWYYGGSRHGQNGLAWIPWDSNTCSKIINSRQKCSDPTCCGNPRRIVGRKIVSIQEKKAGFPGNIYGG